MDTGARAHAHAVNRTFRRLVRDNVRTIVMVVAIIVFVWLLQEVLEGEAIKLDTLAYQVIVLHMRRPWLTPIMQSVSELALPVVLMVVILTVEAFAPGRWPGLCAAVNLICVFMLNTLLKVIVHRPRPDGFRLIAETGYSFPSGHSMIAMAFYGLLAWMVWRYERDRLVRYLCVIGFGIVVVAVGFSRIYLGVHYFTDVLAGFAVSLAWLCLYVRLFVPLFMPRELAGHHLGKGTHDTPHEG